MSSCYLFMHLVTVTVDRRVFKLLVRASSTLEHSHDFKSLLTFLRRHSQKETPLN